MRKMRNRRIPKVIGSLLCVLLIIGTAAYAQGETYKGLPVAKVYINGQPLQTDVPAVILDSRTLVPLRAVSETLGAEVEWDAAPKTVTLTKGDQVIRLTVNQRQAFIDQKAVDLDVPAVILDSRTLVPLRFISQAFGAQVSWNQAEMRVDVASAGSGTQTSLSAPAWVWTNRSSSRGVGIYWAPVPGATQYEISRNGKIIVTTSEHISPGYQSQGFGMTTDFEGIPGQDTYAVRAVGGQWTTATFWNSDSPPPLSSKTLPAPAWVNAELLLGRADYPIIHVSWASVEGACNYQLEQANGEPIEDRSKPFVTLATLSSSETTWGVRDPMAGWWHKYRARPLDCHGRPGAVSAETQVIVVPPQPSSSVPPDSSSVLPAPAWISIGADPAAGTITISWAAVPGANNEYSIERNGQYIGSVGSQNTSYTDRNIAPNQRYRYRVQAANWGPRLGEWSPYTAEISTDGWPAQTSQGDYGQNLWPQISSSGAGSIDFPDGGISPGVEAFTRRVYDEYAEIFGVRPPARMTFEPRVSDRVGEVQGYHILMYAHPWEPFFVRYVAHELAHVFQMAYEAQGCGAEPTTYVTEGLAEYLAYDATGSQKVARVWRGEGTGAPGDPGLHRRLVDTLGYILVEPIRWAMSPSEIDRTKRGVIPYEEYATAQRTVRGEIKAMGPENKDTVRRYIEQHYGRCE